MSTVDVSVVIPAYNGEAFVADAVQSVLGQTAGRAECIVVDDGSTDGTACVVKAFGDAVRLLRRTNGGVAAARNTGIDAATGRWVAFLDADDVWLPDKLQRQLAIVADRPDVALVYTGLRVVDRDLRPVEDLPAPDPAVALRNSLLLEQPSMSIPSTAIVPRALLAAIGGFDERLSTSADTDLACRLCLQGPVASITEPLVLYRLHENQMHSNLQAMAHDMRLVHDKLFPDPALPAELRGLRRRAAANLWATVAAEELHRGALVDGGRHAARAVIADPARAGALALSRVRRLLGRRTR